MDREVVLEHLEDEYRGAFRDWARKVEQVRSTDPASEEGKEAQNCADAAETRYRERRDRLADRLR